MSAKRFSIIFLNVGGLVLGLLGLFLPWAEWSWIPGRFGEWNPMLGINIPVVGLFSFTGWFLAVLSRVLITVLGKQKLLLMSAIAGGIMIMICAFAWVVNPGALSFIVSSRVYRASYGVYVSFVGGALTFAGATLSL